MYLSGIICVCSRSRVQLPKLWLDGDKFSPDWYGVRIFLPYFGWYQEVLVSDTFSPTRYLG
jgi:hypothetical protein